MREYGGTWNYAKKVSHFILFFICFFILFFSYLSSAVLALPRCL